MHNPSPVMRDIASRVRNSLITAIQFLSRREPPTPQEEPPRPKPRATPPPTKLDPRTAFFYEAYERHIIDFGLLRELKALEQDQLAQIAGQRPEGKREITNADTRYDDQEAAPGGDVTTLDTFEEPRGELQDPWFAPITHALHFRNGDPYVDVLIRADATANELREMEIDIISQVGNIYSAFIPLSRFQELLERPSIRSIEAARPVFPTLDTAIVESGIKQLHDPPLSLTGSGVIVGIIDQSALDFYHPDFMTPGGDTRVIWLWDQAASGPGTTPAHFPYGIEYNKAQIVNELNTGNQTNNYYTIVNHQVDVNATAWEHGTGVAGVAAGAGLAHDNAGKTYIGAAPGAEIIYVRAGPIAPEDILASTTRVREAFAYIFEKAAQEGKPCVVNMSDSDNQGPHDGTTLGEITLDDLLNEPGRAIIVSAGNTNDRTRSPHAAGTLSLNQPVTAILEYANGADKSDEIEIWYTAQDRVNLTLTFPPGAGQGPITVVPGASSSVTLSNNVTVFVGSILNDSRNGDNVISILILTNGSTIPTGEWKFDLTATTLVNGRFDAWVDRNNQDYRQWHTPLRKVGEGTIAVPATGHRVIAIGNHQDFMGNPHPAIHPHSGCGPTRDGRVKPDLCASGTNIQLPGARNMILDPNGPLFRRGVGTSFSAPLVAGTCALLFQCRGATATWADLKQILITNAGQPGPIPNNAFGNGYLKAGNICAQAAAEVDIWLRDSLTDDGNEPYTGQVCCFSPDIVVLDHGGNQPASPVHNPANRFNNIVEVTVRNRGTASAQDIQVYLYWANSATHIPFGPEWRSSGIFTEAPNYLQEHNQLSIPNLDPGQSKTVRFAWAPPAPGSDRGDAHFCLIARLEHNSDPSNVGAGNWSASRNSNNIALRNVHVAQINGSNGGATFWIAGTGDDGLIIIPALAQGTIALTLPIQALPWREAAIVDELGQPRQPFGSDDETYTDPLVQHSDELTKERLEQITGIRGAHALILRDGFATIEIKHTTPRVIIPEIRCVPEARCPVELRVLSPELGEAQRFIHVTQMASGQIVGGMTLALRTQAETEADV